MSCAMPITPRMSQRRRSSALLMEVTSDMSFTNLEVISPFSHTVAQDRVGYARQRNAPVVRRLVERAQREGVTPLPAACAAARGDGEEHAPGRPAAPLTFFYGPVPIGPRADAICICMCMYKA